MTGKNAFSVRDAIKSFLENIFNKRRETETDGSWEDEKEEGNPYLDQIREIMEQVLEMKKIPYEAFAPILIDGRESNDTLMAAELLSRDLNRLVVLTERPEYFEAYADNMYEEQGLIVEIFLKDTRKIDGLLSKISYGNVILDFEEADQDFADVKYEKILYIPIFKRRWESVGNLDIAVPIGYNVMIVRGHEMRPQQRYSDKFEQAFYENEY